MAGNGGDVPLQWANVYNGLILHQNYWEHFQHQADIGIRGCGDSPESAFAQVALALTGVITDPDLVEPLIKVHVACQSVDMELLLVDWLNTLLYEMNARNMLFSRFDVRIAGTSLEADAYGEKTIVEKHQPGVEIKAATYNELHFGQDENGKWLAQCVVDV